MRNHFFIRGDDPRFGASFGGGCVELVGGVVCRWPESLHHPLGPVTDRGDWMQTFTGRAFYPMDPKPEDVDPLDIAHALGMTCRYGGHVTRFYSVAEHCVLMSYAVAPEDALWALLHDATEAYVGDMIRPLKRSMPAYRQTEDRLSLVIAERFGLDPVCPAGVKEADNRILLDERAAVLGPSPQPWSDYLESLTPLGVTIKAWSPVHAGSQYLARLTELTGSKPRTSRLLTRHPFGDVCQHGVQFLDQCDACPGGWQPSTTTAPHSPGGGS